MSNIMFKEDSHNAAISAMMGTGLYNDDIAIVDGNAPSQASIGRFIPKDGYIAGYTMHDHATPEQVEKLAKLFAHIVA